MTDEELIAYFTSLGYRRVRKLPDGEFAGLATLIFTTGLCIGLNGYGWFKRFCYEREEDAITALASLQSCEDEPTGWIARRPEK